MIQINYETVSLSLRDVDIVAYALA